MSDYDFDRMKEYHLIDKRFAYAPRKRVPHNGHRNNFEEETQILINGDIDGKPSDPEYSDLLKEYDSDSDDSEVHLLFTFTCTFYCSRKKIVITCFDITEISL